MNPKLLTTPFAQDGIKNNIPESNAPEVQNATYTTGFPDVTQRKISEGGIPPDRADFNGVLNEITQNVVHQNKGLGYEFDEEYANKIGGYPIHAELMLGNGDRVVNTIAANTRNPNIDMTGWKNTNFQPEIDSIKADLNASDAEILYLSNQMVLKADLTYVDDAIGAISTDATKFYPTLAEANADIANLAVNQPVQVGEIANGGLWYKATADATSLTKSPYDPVQMAAADATTKADAAQSNAIDYSEDLAGNLRYLNDNSEFTDEFALSSVDVGVVDTVNNVLHYIEDGVMHFQIPVSFDGTPSIDQFFKALADSYQLLINNGEYALSDEAEYAIIDSADNIAFSVEDHQNLMETKHIQDKSYVLLNPEEYALSSANGDVQIDLENNVLYATEDYLKILNFVDNYKPKSNPYIPFVNSSTHIGIFNSDDLTEKLINSLGTPSAPRQLQNDCVEWDIDDAETPTVYAQAPLFNPQPLSPRKRIAFWGHSFVENPVMARTVATTTGLYVYNFGKSGLRSYGISGRHNSPSIKYKPVGGSIPASGSVNLETSSFNGLWCMFGFNSGVVTPEQLKCSLSGVNGYIMWDGTNCIFTRETSGASVAVSNYVDCIVKPYTTQSTALVPSNTLYENQDECIQVVWLGRNNIDEVDTILSNYVSFIEELRTKVKRLVIMPEFPSDIETNGTERAAKIALINSTLESLYPDFYCKIGNVDALQNFKNHHNPSYADDVLDVANGVTPRTLRYDNLHPSLSMSGNGASPFAEYALHVGAVVNANFIVDFLELKGWI